LNICTDKKRRERKATEENR